MTFDSIIGLVLFAFVGSATPGPNNVMLMASGANFGFRRTIPHMLGISIGSAIMIVLVGGGLARLFDAVPAIYMLLKMASALYLLYLAWRIATAAGVRRRAGAARPLTFLQAATFQWVNPKAWALALTAVTVHVSGAPAPFLLLAALIFSAVNLPSVSFWALMGRDAARFLQNPARLRIFNVTMAALLVLSLYPLLGLDSG